MCRKAVITMQGIKLPSGYGPCDVEEAYLSTDAKGNTQPTGKASKEAQGSVVQEVKREVGGYKRNPGKEGRCAATTLPRRERKVYSHDTS